MDIEFPEFYERKRIKEAGGAVNDAINRLNAGLMRFSQRAMTIDEQIQLRVGMAGMGEGDIRMAKIIQAIEVSSPSVLRCVLCADCYKEVADDGK